MRIGVDWRRMAEDVRGRLTYGDTIRGAVDVIGIELHQIYRLMSGKPIRAEAVLAICRWLEKPAESYLIDSEAAES